MSVKEFSVLSKYILLTFDKVVVQVCIYYVINIQTSPICDHILSVACLPLHHFPLFSICKYTTNYLINNS